MHDNALLNHAASLKGEVVPVFCWDEREWNQETEFNSRKCGILRCRFYTEAMQDLRKKLEAVGLNLLSAFEHPEVFLPSLIDSDKKTVLIYQKEVDPEFSKLEAKVKSELKSKDGKAKFVAFEPDLMHTYDFDPKEKEITKFGELRLQRQDVPEEF